MNCFFRNRHGTLRIVAAIALFGAMSGATCPGTGPVTPGTCGNRLDSPPSMIASDHVLGDAAAPVTVFEYSDLQCPFCGSFDRNQFPKLQSDYIDMGLVRYVYRHFPLENPHPDARAAAEASECAADQDLFFEFIHAVFSDATRQQDMSADVLREIADEAGLDLTLYDACITADGKGPRVDQDVNSGNALGVGGTPTFFVNGISANSQTLFDVIECELARLGG